MPRDPEPLDPSHPIDPAVEVTWEDRGSFCHAVCSACGWVGPGRRSRRVAERDAQAHPGACPERREDGIPEPTLS